MAFGVRFWDKQGNLVIDSTQESFVLSNEIVAVPAGVYHPTQMATLMGGNGPYFFRMPVGAKICTQFPIGGSWYITGNVQARRIIPASEYVEANRYGIKFWSKSPRRKTWTLEAALAGIKVLKVFSETAQETFVTSDHWFMFLQSKWAREGYYAGGTGSEYSLRHFGGGLERVNATTYRNTLDFLYLDTFPLGFQGPTFYVMGGRVSVANG